MKFLPDQVVARLQTGMQTPDLSGTRYRAIELLGQGGMGAGMAGAGFYFAAPRGPQGPDDGKQLG